MLESASLENKCLIIIVHMSHKYCICIVSSESEEFVFDKSILSVNMTLKHFVINVHLFLWFILVKMPFLSQLIFQKFKWDDMTFKNFNMTCYVI